MSESHDEVGHVHSHAVHLRMGPGQRRKVRTILAAIVVPLAIATIIGLVVLWPRGQTPVGSVQLNYAGSTTAVGTVTSIGQADELGQYQVRMSVDGVEVPVHVPFEIVGNGLDVGDTIKALFSPGSAEGGSPYIFVDFVRDVPLGALVALYVIVVVAVARWKGFAALLGLSASLAVVGAFMLPALMVGTAPLAVIAVGASAMMFASIYFAHGVSIRTTTAVIGTFAGLLITGVLAAASVTANNLTGTLSDDAISLAGQLTYLNMSDILLCGIILAGLGALNDVTITQVSTVWELQAANEAASRTKVFRQAMVIGRDHIASTVYTLAFAYVGTSLPLLMSAALVDRGVLDLFTVGQIAEEIVRTLVASIGLVLAIPMTTAIATVLAPIAPSRKVAS
ncbi:MAG: YibE/F family protein [Trueperella sp.]|uniref:YibE/F family protein n=1 Tax=Trueperella sp. TaxID=2699835 RepID=UPI002A9101E7|nr:YibE/F family protein [Trueperella sp.]MDY5403040.1 YibE/F family protein [Trueperella sp.]